MSVGENVHRRKRPAEKISSGENVRESFAFVKSPTFTTRAKRPFFRIVLVFTERSTLPFLSMKPCLIPFWLFLKIKAPHPSLSELCLGILCLCGERNNAECVNDAYVLMRCHIIT
uniref:Uncharacterized protein n=1 Tax=Steinernema glaseri TaxID=37863 RepID=A0A1I7YNL9_9BILA